MSPKEQENTQRVSTFLSPDVLERLKEEAKENGQTVSSMMRLIIMRYLSEKK